MPNISTFILPKNTHKNIFQFVSCHFYCVFKRPCLQSFNLLCVCAHTFPIYSICHVHKKIFKFYTEIPSSECVYLCVCDANVSVRFKCSKCSWNFSWNHVKSNQFRWNYFVNGIRKKRYQHVARFILVWIARTKKFGRLLVWWACYCLFMILRDTSTYIHPLTHSTSHHNRHHHLHRWCVGDKIGNSSIENSAFCVCLCVLSQTHFKNFPCPFFYMHSFLVVF